MVMSTPSSMGSTGIMRQGESKLFLSQSDFFCNVLEETGNIYYVGENNFGLAMGQE
jgi:hypothetical protein